MNEQLGALVAQYSKMKDGAEKWHLKYAKKYFKNNHHGRYGEAFNYQFNKESETKHNYSHILHIRIHWLHDIWLEVLMMRNNFCILAKAFSISFLFTFLLLFLFFLLHILLEWKHTLWNPNCCRTRPPDLMQGNSPPPPRFSKHTQKKYFLQINTNLNHYFSFFSKAIHSHNFPLVV